ncbi:MAG: metallophosphatase [Bacteroidia bacterium]|nr:metallophosphatase [Bacteroidia bacterium]
MVALSDLPFDLFAKNKIVKITILHTNDWHSRIEPFPKDGGKYAGLGGVETRAALIQKIREQESNVLLLDAGDIFQGTPYFNFFGGELEFKLMSKMKYDVATLGNHDFDNGIDGIIRQLPHATFEFINCNYSFEGTTLKEAVKPYKIFTKGGIRIGVIGVGVDLNGLVANNLWKQIKYNDPVGIVNEISTHLKSTEKCDFVICLSHLGYEYKDDKISDIRLAENSENIDLIIGGHTHTFLAKPVQVKNKKNKYVIINQVGWAGLQLGKIDLYFDSSKSLVNKGFADNLYIDKNKC